MTYKTYSNRPQRETRERARCALCGYEPPREYWNNGDFSFSKCPSCGLVYQYPRPLEKELIQRYDSDYFSYELENEKAFFSLMIKALSDVHFFDEVEMADGGSDFLDVGCATGMLIEYLKERGWEEHGVEVCEPSARYGIDRRGVRIHIGTLAEAAFEGESFDVVHASHLIEHLADPASFVEEMFRILKPEGRAIITTPNLAGLQARLFGKEWRSAIADHMYLFSLKTLRSLLEKKGFIYERSQTWGGIAQGIAPTPVKKILDYSAKRFGFGDVMVIRVRKPDV